MSGTLSVGEYLISELKRLGISRVYGIPGDFVIKFFKLIEDDADIELYTFSHEPAVGFAAIGDARANRKPAVVVVTYGPGILNALNAVACAYAEKTPLIMVAGGPPLSARTKNFFMHHTVKSCGSLLEAVTQVTAKAVILDDPHTAPEKIAQALGACQQNMLPVYLELPADMVNQKIDNSKNSASTLPVDEANLKQATDIIAQRIQLAKKPVVMAGIESDRFNLKPQILQLAEKLNLPVVSTVLARDHMPKDSPNFFGTYLGVAGNPAADKLVAESDFVLILGEMLSDVNLGAKLTATKKGELVWCFSGQVNTYDQMLANVPLKELVAGLGKAKIQRKGLPLPDKVPLKVNRACKYTGKLLVMGEVIDAVNWLFGEYGEMPVVADTGDCLFATLNIQTS